MSTNLSQQKREDLLETLEYLKRTNTDIEVKAKLTEIEKELKGKKYGLHWEEHEEKVDVELRKKIPVFSEIKEKEIIIDRSEPINFLLQGDNLHSLYLLEKTHKGRVDIIYIDPPYNTNNKEFVYDDTMIGEKDYFRHSKWLSFMYRRLLKAQKLLSNKGIIFISIDDNEYSQLKLLCDEIFDETNYIATLHWKKKKQPSYLHGQVAGVMEYVLIYAKNRNNIDKLSLSTPTDSNTRVDNATNQIAERTIKKGIRVKLNSNIKVIKAGVYKNKTMETEFLDDVYIENGRTQNSFRAKARYRDSQERIDMFCDEDVLFITKNYGFRRDKLKEELNKKKAITDLLLDWGDNQDSDQELKQIFNTKVFSYPKPVMLIKNLIKSTGYSNATILDFFAGSGTTAQAVLELNEEDQGKRKFILCTNNENNICEEITYSRIKTVMTGIKTDNSKYSEGISSNLKYFKTNYIDRYHIDNDEIEISDELMKNIKELIILDNNIWLDQEKIRLISKEEDLLKMSEWNLKNIESIYIFSDILLDSETEDKLIENNIKIIEVPEYYYRKEIEEI